jgi:hypothetical protein
VQLERRVGCEHINAQLFARESIVVILISVTIEVIWETPRNGRLYVDRAP